MIKFKTLQIKGFRGFVDSGEINLCTPDGETAGSGLNIFVGENGGCKTTVLKAVNSLTVSSYSGQSRFSYFDFNNKSENESIEIIGKLEKNVEYAMVPPYDRKLEIKEFKTSIKHRDRKSPNKFLSPKFTISNILEPTSRSPEWFSREEISDFYLGFDNNRFTDDGLNIFYFGPDRKRQTKKGFSTTFSRVMDDLNWKFIKEAKKDKNQSKILEKWKGFRSEVEKDKLGKEIKKVLKERFGREDLSNVNLELMNLEEPYSEAFFAIRDKNSLGQIPLPFLGSGVELIFSILFLKQIANQSKGTIIYCIDEPELSLHPQWQKILFDILKEEAKTKQIFIATHSLHFIDPSLLANVRRFYIEREEIKFSQLTEERVKDPKIRQLFHLENREIMFSNSVVLIEGVDDKIRLGNFLQDSSTDLFIMNGLQNLKRVKGVCDELKISFRAVVDLDYLYYKGLSPDLTPEELEHIDEVATLNEIMGKTTCEKTIKEIKKIRDGITGNLQKCLGSKIKYKMSRDTVYKETVESEITRLKSENIYVLPKGVIEDYLDEYGKPKTDELGKEILDIVTK